MDSGIKISGPPSNHLSKMKFSNSVYCRTLSVFAALLVVVAQIFATPDGDAAPSRLIVPFFFFPAGWSMTIFLLIVMSVRERARLIGCLAACAAIGAVVGVLSGGSAKEAMRFGVIAAGVAPYLFALARIAANSGAERGYWIDTFCVSSLIHISALALPFFRDQTKEWLPRILDSRIALLDESFGLQPSSLMAQAFAAVPVLHTFSLAAYSLVQIPIVLVAAVQWRRKAPGDYSILPGFIIASGIGFTCYWLAPAMGPRPYFGYAFPFLHVTADYLANHRQLEINPCFPRNAMPSMHISWAVLVFLYTRGHSAWTRFNAALFVFLTGCATLGLGEHYFMDLIVASSLVLLVRALCAIELTWVSVERLRAIAVGLALLVFWIGAIRFGLPMAPPVVVALAGLTLGASFWFERALARAESGLPNELENPPSTPSLDSSTIIQRIIGRDTAARARHVVQRRG